jgi:hypothetical protein
VIGYAPVVQGCAEPVPFRRLWLRCRRCGTLSSHPNQRERDNWRTCPGCNAVVVVDARPTRRLVVPVPDGADLSEARIESDGRTPDLVSTQPRECWPCGHPGSQSTAVGCLGCRHTLADGSLCNDWIRRARHLVGVDLRL